MRYAFLLLTLCVSFGTLDSVSRHGHAVSSFSPTGTSPGRTELIRRMVFHPVTNVGVVIHVVRSHIYHAKTVGYIKRVGRSAVDQAAETPITQASSTQASLTQASSAELSEADAFKTAVPLTPAVFFARNKAFAAVMAESVRNSLLDPHGVQFGGMAGLNWSGAAARGSSGKVSGKPLSGLSLGTFADVPLKKHVSFRPVVQYAYEGYQANVSGNNVTIHVAYLGTSLDLVYHKKRFYWGAGPYWSYATEGTYTFGGINTDMQFGRNYSTGSYLRKTDYGAGGTAGLLMDRNFVLGARFDLGLKNIAAAGLRTPVRTKSLTLSVLYVFRNRANAKPYRL